MIKLSEETTEVVDKIIEGTLVEDVLEKIFFTTAFTAATIANIADEIFQDCQSLILGFLVVGANP